MTPSPREELASVRLALELIHEFGSRAREVAEERAADPANSNVAERWRTAAAAATALIQADLHMRIALDLLDAAGENRAAAKLDEAMVALGVRARRRRRSSSRSARVSTVTADVRSTISISPDPKPTSA